MTNEEQKYVLAVMEEVLNEGHVRTWLRHSGEDGLAVDMLTTMHANFGVNNSEVLGEFYFAPNPGENTEVQYFTSIITLVEKLKKDNLKEMYEALTKLNFYLPVGSFAIDKEDGALIYKHVVPLRTSCVQDELVEQIDILIAHNLRIAEDYIDILLQVADGKATVKDVMEMF